MIELPDLPEGSAIRVIRGRNEIRLRWPGRDRLAAARILVPLSLWAVAAIAFVAADRIVRTEVALSVGVACMLAAMAGLLWYWFGRPRVSTLILGRESLTFVAPARRVLFEITYFPVTRPYDPEKADRAEWEALRRAHKKRKRHTIQRSDVTRIEPLSHEGGGVAVETRAKAHRFGRDLGTEDSDWLADILRRWRAAG